MNLVWKLLRQHISVGQFVGFFFANLFGMLIVLLGFQFYRDVLPVFTSGDSFMKSDYLIVSKKVNAGGTFSGATHDFTTSEIEDFSSQPFVKNLGKFTSVRYKVNATMGINGMTVLNTELPLECVPDRFVGVPITRWQFHPGDKTVPIILPRSYLTMYNFGFARAHDLPKISDGLVGMIDFTLFLRGNGHEEELKGKVIGFSSRISSILVPQAFMDWSNEQYAPDVPDATQRLIVEVKNPADEHITNYLQNHNYDVDDDKLNTEKTAYFLKLVVVMVVSVGLVISLLSFYMLMLSIYLLVQKNTQKLENLLLIGYSTNSVARPYQLLTIGLNALVLGMALVILYFMRAYYMDIIFTLFPQLDEGSMLPTIGLGLLLLCFVSMANIWVIRYKVMNIWLRK